MKSKSARQSTVAIAVGLVVLAIVGGVISARLLIVDDHRTPAGVASVASVPSPPAGTRWVGWGQVVVAVPDWWTTGETRCLAPVEDTIYFDMAAIAECVNAPPTATVRKVSALAVLDATSGYGEMQVRTMRPVATVDGREVVEREDCEGWFDGVCRRLFAVPSEGVVFAVTIAEEGDGNYEDIRDSLLILPDTHTTVPLASADGWTPAWGAEPPAVDALVKALQNAGLSVTIEKSAPAAGGDSGFYADLPEGSLLDVSPGLGSVIDAGGTVTVTIAGPSGRPKR